jgi:hypothetical protein
MSPIQWLILRGIWIIMWMCLRQMRGPEREGARKRMERWHDQVKDRVGWEISESGE